MSECCCSYVVVKSEVLATAAQTCLNAVVAAQEKRQQDLNTRVENELYQSKNRWYHFGKNKAYVPTQEEIDRERNAVYSWTHALSGFPKYHANRHDFYLSGVKKTAERLLAASKMGEAVSVSTEDILTISYGRETNT